MRRTGCGMTLAMLGCAAVVAGALVWWATAVLDQPKP